MRERLLESFIAAVQEGSFTAAAKRLYVSQPALSQQIAQLEKEVGFKLFYRANSAVALTEAGKEFYDSVRRLFALYDEILSRCRDIAGVSENAPIRPCSSSSVDNSLNLIIFKAFLEKYPELRIEPHDTETSKRVSDVTLNKADVAIYYPSLEVEENGLEFHHLFYDRTYWIMTPDHPLAGNDVIEPEDLFGHTVYMNKEIRNENFDRLRAFISEHKEQIEIKPVSLSASTVANAVSDGGIVHSLGAAAKNTKRGIVSVPMEWESPIEVGIICRPNPRPIVKKYIEVAQSLFADYEA